ncbi:TPA: hypothetical protein HA246_03440 [Candidatus Woesearchaeota archaeon]|nr:hypothetical protein [Candidatus Woesearchaeota archaeon]
MRDITSNEANFILLVFRHPESSYNANNIAKLLGISPMGALKIAKNLVKDRVFLSKILGKAIFYDLNLSNDYVCDYIQFLLKRESVDAAPYVKRWVNEIIKAKSASAAILFGSVLKKQGEAKDIDVLFIIDDGKFSKLKKEVEEINLVNDKKLHPIYQTEQNFKENLKKQDKIISDSLNGIIVFGHDELIKLVKSIKQ